MKWAAVLLATLVGAGVAQARLKPEDRVALTGCLEKISVRWHQPSVDKANSIFTRGGYGHDDWEDFFRGYLKTHGLSDELRNYLAYPIFAWFDDAVHQELQRGLWPVLVERVEKMTEPHRHNLSQSLHSDRSLRESLFNLHRLAQIYLTQTRPYIPRAEILGFYQQHAGRYPEWFADNRPLAGQSFAGSLRVQVLNNLVESAHSAALSSELSPSAPETVARLAGLSGRKLELWQQQHIMLIDNGYLDAEQLQVMQQYFQLIPAGLPRPWIITQNDGLGATGPASVTQFASSSINIFGNRLGTVPENQFPSDVAPRQSDIFLACLSHEANHIVNAHWIEKDPSLNRRQKDLIAAAGAETRQYLRSMFPRHTFTQAPQEFFASMANQWFCDSEYTLSLALKRFSQGYHEPLHQALFFADVYSLRGPTTRFYVAGPRGQLKSHEVPLGRDGQGRIHWIGYQGGRLWLNLDRRGNVRSIRLESKPASSPKAEAAAPDPLPHGAKRRSFPHR